jgi:hypothetical protein
MNSDDKAAIFLRWQKFLEDEWNESDSAHSYITEGRAEAMNKWLIGKLVALFTECESNSNKIRELSLIVKGLCE